MGIDFVFDSHGNMWTIEEWSSVCPLTWNSERVLTEDDVKNFYDPSGYNEQQKSPFVLAYKGAFIFVSQETNGDYYE